MSLGARLLWLGAIVPALALLGAIVIGRTMFAREIFGAVDDAMRTQAAVEAVSLFDRGGEPHLHMRFSPLLNVADPSAGAVYDEAGEAVARWPEDADIPARVVPAEVPEHPVLETVRRGGDSIRELRVRVHSPDGRRWALWLGHDLAPHEAALVAYEHTGGVLVVVVTLGLLAIQIAHASRLTARIRRLAAHMRKLREGQLDEAPPPDASTDLLGELRESIADATHRLRAARDARERLIADAAHELRTPLATMRTTIDVTLRRERTVEQLRDALLHAREEVDRLTSTAADLLELASGAHAPRAQETTSLARLVREAISAAHGPAEEREVELVLDGDEEVLFEGDAAAVRRALDNLLANALAFSPIGGRVDVGVEADGGWARVRVRDHGPGIPEAEREAVFEPFHRLDRRRSGTGLGLAIVRDVASRHGGRAYAREALGGAELVLELPGRAAV